MKCRAIRTVLGGLVMALLVMACEPVLPPESAPASEPETTPEEPEPEAEPEPPDEPEPEPIVSFATRETHISHVVGSNGSSVSLPIELSPPATKPLTIGFEGWLYTGSIVVSAGASRATISVLLKDYPGLEDGGTLSTNILLTSGDGYKIDPDGHEHRYLITYIVNEPEPEPEPEDPSSPYATCDEALREWDICGCAQQTDDDGKVHVFPRECVPLLGADPRCPYPVMMADGGRGDLHARDLLEQVSTAGTLCATANAAVSGAALDRVSRASTAMLRHRPDLLRFGLAPSSPGKIKDGHIILLYAESERDFCNFFPQIYTDLLCELPTLATAFYVTPIIFCPEEDFDICIHEIAHAVHSVIGIHFEGFPEQLPDQKGLVIERFVEPDVAELWSGYALTNHREFFAEMSAIYFCVGTGATFPTLHCADELQAYDPETYEVVHAIYRGSADLR